MLRLLIRQKPGVLCVPKSGHRLTKTGTFKVYVHTQVRVRGLEALDIGSLDILTSTALSLSLPFLGQVIL